MQMRTFNIKHFLSSRYLKANSLTGWILLIQVRQEPANVEALEKSNLIYPLQQEIDNAKLLFRSGHYGEVIEILGRVVEVSFLLSIILFEF